MSNHTPEPWNNKRIDIAVHYFESINAEIAFTGKSDEAMANARRIVACVNACVGLETEHLENQTMLGETLLDRFELRNKQEAELKSQRDELLVDLEEAVKYLEPRVSGGKVGVSLVPRLKSTITKAKGGAA